MTKKQPAAVQPAPPAEITLTDWLRAVSYQESYEAGVHFGRHELALELLAKLKPADPASAPIEQPASASQSNPPAEPA